MKNLRYVSTWAFHRALDGTLFRGRRGGKGSGGRKKFFVGRECPDFGTAALVKWGHQGKGGKKYDRNFRDLHHVRRRRPVQRHPEGHRVYRAVNPR